MSSLLLENQPVLPKNKQRNVQREDRETLKRSFFVSLGIHASLLLTIIIAAAIPHRFHFEQMTLIELAGLKVGASTPGNGANTASVSPATRTSVPSSAKDTKVPSLKPKAQAPKSAPTTPAKSEKISLKPNKKSTATNVTKPDLDLKDRILRKFSAMNGMGTQNKSANASSAQTNQPAGPEGLQGIGTDVPFPFASYLSDVRDRITDVWEEPSWISANAGGAKAVVVFRIHRDGAVSKVLLAIPSGMTMLDKSAVQAVEAANPLPPLPAEFKDAFLDVHLEFELSR